MVRGSVVGEPLYLYYIGNISGSPMARRALVTLPDGVWHVIDELKGTLGDGNSEIIRNIVIAHLSEKGILIPSYNIPATVKDDHVRGSASQETNVDVLSRVLVRKGVITREELDKIRKARRVAGITH